jgi:hypothetical protein
VFEDAPNGNDLVRFEFDWFALVESPFDDLGC